MKKGGIPNVRQAALSVIQDWNKGLIPFYSLPPETKDIQSSEIVGDWAKDFDQEGILTKFDEKALTEFKEKLPPPSTFTVLEPSKPKPTPMDSDLPETHPTTSSKDQGEVPKAKKLKKKKKIAKKKERRERRKSVVEAEMEQDKDDVSATSKPTGKSGESDEYDFATDWN